MQSYAIAKVNFYLVFASIKVWHRTFYKWVYHILMYADGNEQDDIGEIEYSHFCSGSLNLID